MISELKMQTNLSLMTFANKISHFLFIKLPEKEWVIKHSVGNGNTTFLKVIALIWLQV
jgi:hypothetical protein